MDVEPKGTEFGVKETRSQSKNGNGDGPTDYSYPDS